MRKQRLDMFMKGFGTINEYLKEMYQMITLGGDAELELVDSLDPFSEGIVFRYESKIRTCGGRVLRDKLVTCRQLFLYLFSGVKEPGEVVLKPRITIA